MTAPQSGTGTDMAARYTLYIGSKFTSSWSLRPWLAMKMAGLEFDEHVIALRQPDTKQELQAHSPSGKVPALKIDENGQSHLVWDSLAICETLAERHPEAGLWPTDAMARAQARCIVAEMHSGFPGIRKELSMDVAARLPTPELSDAAQTQIARVVAIWEQTLDRFGSDGAFLFGRFCIADAFYAPVATRFRTYRIALSPGAQIYADRILSLPAMRAWEQAAKAETASAV